MPRRTAITTRQKGALRDYRRTSPTATHQQLQQWFLNTFGRSIANSSISEILSSRYVHLDPPIARPPDSKRYRAESWPDLEQALYDWILRAEGQITITGDIIKQKAQFF